MKNLAFALLLTVSFAAAAQEGFGKLDPTPPDGKTPDQIIQAFSSKESDFAAARENYTFRQDVKFNTLDDDHDRPDGEYRQIADIGFDSEGRRTEHVTFAPQNTIERLIMTKEDFDDIAHRQPFVMTTKDLPDYNLAYVGKQRVDEIDTYVFDAEPKKIEKNRRYYKGRIWVDQRDLMIVLISGKAVPDDVRRGHENLSPPFTTYYEQVDGKYWFPTYTKAEGILHFTGGDGYMAQNVHVKSIVRYTDYKQFRGKARILYNGEDITNNNAPGDKPNAPADKPQEPKK